MRWGCNIDLAGVKLERKEQKIDFGIGSIRKSLCFKKGHIQAQLFLTSAFC